MTREEARGIFELAKERGLCTSIRGFAKCVGVVPSTICNIVNNPGGNIRPDVEEKLNLIKEELELKDPDRVDWQSFRREAAKDILCAFASNLDDTPDKFDECFYTHCAVEWADALIK